MLVTGLLVAKVIFQKPLSLEVDSLFIPFSPYGCSSSTHLVLGVSAGLKSLREGVSSLPVKSKSLRYYRVRICLNTRYFLEFCKNKC